MHGRVSSGVSQGLELGGATAIDLAKTRPAAHCHSTVGMTVEQLVMNHEPGRALAWWTVQKKQRRTP